MNLLLEIGCEEIPDWMLAGALEYLGSAIADSDKELSWAATRHPHRRHPAPPRRSRRRPDRAAARLRRARLGTGQIRPAAAVAGFAKKQGVDPAQLEILSDGKAEKYSYVRKIAGPRTPRHPRRSAAAARSSKRLSRKPCTGPAKAARASSARSAGL